MRRACVLVCLLLASSYVACNWADHEPYCLFPHKFPVSMTTSPAYVDVAKYMGTWYEQARKPQPNEVDCKCATAIYSVKTEGSDTYVEVNNICITFSGRDQSAVAKGYSQNDRNTWLDIYFTPIIAGSYWILDIDANYQWVVVGEPCMKMAWILSRNQTLDPAIVQSKVAFLKTKGYDTSNMIYRPAIC